MRKKKGWREKRNTASAVKKNIKLEIVEKRLRERWPSEWFFLGSLS